MRAAQKSEPRQVLIGRTLGPVAFKLIRINSLVMASELSEADAASGSQDEALAKLAAVSLSLSTDRSDLWRDKGITFRPYKDERDMVHT